MKEQPTAIRAVFAAMATFALCTAATVTAADDDPLQVLRWKHRILLVFAESMADEHAQSMKEMLDSARDGLVERDLLTGWILSGEPSRLAERALNADAAARLRARASMGDDEFAVLLIGKDGGVKARYGDVPDLREVFALIDGMPMRRQEMRRRDTRE